MCQNPALCASLPDLQLKGPIGKPPASGWKVLTLPGAAQHLNQSWLQHPLVSDSAKSALYTLIDFLNANGIRGREVSEEVFETAITQWCHGTDAGEKRCPSGYRQLKIKPPSLPWAAAAWETANLALSNDLEPEEVGPALATIVDTLTGLIGGEMGCPICHSHWLTNLEKHPVPENPTLTEARHWLHERHNETREGREPVPYEVIAEKFNWNAPE